jgi:DNA-binding response OmpR family regulator
MDDEVRVLLIEDDEPTAEMYRLRLERDGYVVFMAHDGEEGLRRALEVQPDLVYLDLRLPKMDGFEVLRQLRASPATQALPVIILSNYGEPDLREQGLSLGALDYLVKADTTPAQLSETTDRWADSATAGVGE